MIRLIPALVTIAGMIVFVIHAAEAQTIPHPTEPLLLVTSELQPEQIDPLQERIEIAFGPRGAAMTMGQAIREILQRTGWRLGPATASNAPGAMQTLLNRPLAAVHCELGVCRILQSLEAMAWPCFEVRRHYVPATLVFDLKANAPTGCGAMPSAPAVVEKRLPPPPVRRVVYDNLWSRR